MAADFALYLNEALTEPTPYHGENHYFRLARDRMDRSFAVIADRVKGGAILDIGASPFYLLDRALAHGATRAEGIYFANDTHPLREKPAIYSPHGRIGIVHLDVEHEPLPYADNSFDVVSACEIFEHLEYFPSRIGAEIHRVLKPGGTLLLTVPNVGSVGNILKLVAGKNIYMKYRSDATGRHKHEYTRSQLASLVRHFRMEVVRTGFFPSPTSDKMYLRPIYQVLARTPVVNRYSPVLYVLGRMPDPKPAPVFGTPPADLYVEDRSIEE